MADNKQIAKNVLKAVGGKGNVKNLTHCMTRLRFNLKDDSIPDKDAIGCIDGVLKVVMAPGSSRRSSATTSARSKRSCAHWAASPNRK